MHLNANKQSVCADVYERLTPKGKPPTFFTLIVTQLVSGVWHGLFPGYVLFFISSALMFQSSKVLYRYERNWPKSVQTFPLWTLAKWAYTAFTLNYCASAFLVSLCKLASFWPISSCRDTAILAKLSSGLLYIIRIVAVIEKENACATSNKFCAAC